VVSAGTQRHRRAAAPPDGVPAWWLVREHSATAAPPDGVPAWWLVRERGGRQNSTALVLIQNSELVLN